MMKEPNVTLEISGVSIGYPKANQGKDLVLYEEITVNCHQQEVVCILGLNGAGKSTLLRTIAGFQEPLRGSVRLYDKNIHEIHAKEKAKLLSVVLTGEIPAGQMQAQEIIALGRHPYTNWLGEITSNDKEKIDKAVELAGAQHLLQRKIYSLSDGERQKVMIARALAQDTPVIVLDEPTVHLDLASKAEIFHLLKILAKETGKTIIFSTHDVEWALQVSDSVILLMKSGHWRAGMPSTLIKEEILQTAFCSDLVGFDAGEKRFFLRK